MQAALAAARSGGPGRVLAVHRAGQSLVVSVRPVGGAPDGSTAAERAERSLLSTSKPLAALLQAKVHSSDESPYSSIFVSSSNPL